MRVIVLGNFVVIPTDFPLIDVSHNSSWNLHINKSGFGIFTKDGRGMMIRPPQINLRKENKKNLCKWLRRSHKQNDHKFLWKKLIVRLSKNLFNFVLPADETCADKKWILIFCRKWINDEVCSAEGAHLEQSLYYHHNPNCLFLIIYFG